MEDLFYLECKLNHFIEQADGSFEMVEKAMSLEDAKKLEGYSHSSLAVSVGGEDGNATIFMDARLERIYSKRCKEMQPVQGKKVVTRKVIPYTWNGRTIEKASVLVRSSASEQDINGAFVDAGHTLVKEIQIPVKEDQPSPFDV